VEIWMSFIVEIRYVLRGVGSVVLLFPVKVNVLSVSLPTFPTATCMIQSVIYP